MCPLNKVHTKEATLLKTSLSVNYTQRTELFYLLCIYSCAIYANMAKLDRTCMIYLIDKHSLSGLLLGHSPLNGSRNASCSLSVFNSSQVIKGFRINQCANCIGVYIKIELF